MRLTEGLWEAWTLLVRRVCWLAPKAGQRGQVEVSHNPSLFLGTPQLEPSKHSSPAYSMTQHGTGSRAATIGKKT